jgi:hypothetical protein
MDIREILKVSIVGLVHFRIKKYLTLCKINVACAECVPVRIILGPVFDSPIFLTFHLYVITAWKTSSGKNPLLPILAHFVILVVSYFPLISSCI